MKILLAEDEQQLSRVLKMAMEKVAIRLMLLIMDKRRSIRLKKMRMTL